MKRLTVMRIYNYTLQSVLKLCLIYIYIRSGQYRAASSTTRNYIFSFKIKQKKIPKNSILSIPHNQVEDSSLSISVN